MDVVILAPNPTDITQIPAEVQTVVNVFAGAGHKAFLMTGDDATRSGLARSISNGLIVDLIWYTGHVSRQGIALNDGAIDPGQFAQWVAMTQTEQLVMNGAFDPAHVATIQRHADVEIVAGAEQEREPERETAAFAAYLARAYVAANGDLRTAAERATAAGASHYRYYPAARRLDHMPQTQHSPASNGAANQELAHQVESLVRALRGEWGRPGLIENIDGLRNEFAHYQREDQAWKQGIETKVNALETRPVTMSPIAVMWVLGIVVLFAAFLTFIVFRAAGVT